MSQRTSTEAHAARVTVRALVDVLNRPHILKLLNEELGGALEALAFPRTDLADSGSVQFAQRELYAVASFDLNTAGEEPGITPNIVAGGKQ